MYLIVGLGNPGTQYSRTRHNIGFAYLDHLSGTYRFSFTESKWKAEVAKTNLWGRQVMMVKPLTYMNVSGEAIGRICSYFKINPVNVLVVHDDLDLEPGRVKMVANRGAGGHNGIISTILHLGSKKFSRMRIGVGRPTNSAIEVRNFVLAPFHSAELALVTERFPDIDNGLRLFVEKSSAEAMNYLNSIKGSGN